MKRAIRLSASKDVLRHPNDDVELEVLERLLFEATEDELSKNQTVLVTHSERVKNFNRDNPRWKNVTYRIPVSELLNMYKDMAGRNYVRPTLEQLESRYTLR